MPALHDVSNRAPTRSSPFATKLRLMLPSHIILLWTTHPILQYSALSHKLPLATDHQSFRIKPAAARMPAETAGACSSKGLKILGELDLLCGPLRLFKVRPAQLLQQSLLVCLHLAVPAAQIIVGEGLVQGLQRGRISWQEGRKRRQWRQKQGMVRKECQLAYGSTAWSTGQCMLIMTQRPRNCSTAHHNSCNHPQKLWAFTTHVIYNAFRHTQTQAQTQTHRQTQRHSDTETQTQTQTKTHRDTDTDTGTGTHLFARASARAWRYA